MIFLKLLKVAPPKDPGPVLPFGNDRKSYSCHFQNGLFKTFAMEPFRKKPVESLKRAYCPGPTPQLSHVDAILVKGCVTSMRFPSKKEITRHSKSY